MSLIIFEKLDAESLKRMVTEFHMKDTEISELSGVSVPAIEKRRQLLNLAGGSTLGKKVEDISVFIQNKKLPRFDKSLVTRDKLYEMYETNLMTDLAISKIYNTKEYVISSLRREYGIISKTVTDSKRREAEKNGVRFFGDLSKEEMISEVLESGNFVEIGKSHGISKTSVRNFLKRKGLNPTELLEYCKNSSNTIFTSIQKEIFIGSMLGDGGISQSDLRYYEKHSIAQESYLDWKMECFGLSKEKKQYTLKKKGEGGILSDAYGASFTIRSNPYFNELRKDFYVFNEDKGHITKTTPILYAHDLSNLSLAIWFFDDGFLWHEYPCIFTGAPIKDIEKFVEILNEEKGLDIEITNVLENEESTGYRLKITNTDIFWSLVSGYVSDLMIHKFPSKYRALNRGGLLGVDENRMSELSGFISKVCPDDWKKLLLEKDKCAYIDKIARYYELVGFPKAPRMTSAKFQSLFSNLSKINISKYSTSSRVLKNIPSIGTGVAYSYFPSIFAVETVSKDNAYNLYKDSEKFRKVIRWILNNEKSFNESTLRKELRRFCSVTNFKPLVAKYLCDKYCPENGVVFDYSAGWSGRLIGCCASSKVSKYIGTDVSKQTFFGLRRVARIIGDICNTKKIDIYNFPSEDSDNYISLEKFDVCLSSPPYFDTEKYSVDPEQSYRRYPDYGLWKEKFLIGVISNCYKKLNAGGFFIINVADIKGHKLVQDTYDICSSFFEYIETIVVQTTNAYNNNKFEPIMVFKKSIEDFNNPCFSKVQEQFLEDFSLSSNELLGKSEDIEIPKKVPVKRKNENTVKYTQEDIDRSKEFAISVFKEVGGTLEKSRYSKYKERSTLSLLGTWQIEEVFGTWSSFLNVCGIPVLKKFGNTITILEDFLQACRNNGHFLTFYAYNQISNDTAALSKLKRLFNKNGLLSSFTERLSQVWSSEEESCSFIRTIDNFLAVKKATKHVSSDLSPNS
jgi:hypothetical protein